MKLLALLTAITIIIPTAAACKPVDPVPPQPRNIQLP